MTPQVLIVGAGPTGLVLALWLTRLGIKVRIIDKLAEPGTTSRAVAVQARTLELYRQVGLADAVVAVGVKVAGANFRVRGNRVARASIDHIGEGLSPFPFLLMYPQDVHEQLLIERLSGLGVSVERLTELARFEQQADGVRATLKRPDGSEETCEAAYLAGCDGARSTVRHALEIGFPGGTYDKLFFVADAEVTGPAANGEVNIDLEDSDFLAIFPLNHAGHVRLIGAVPVSMEEERGKLTFDDVKGRAIENLKLAVHQVNWFSTYRVHHRVAERFRAERAFLLGDAAHVHSPVGGQGMNTGIGDAVNLAWKLAAVLQGAAPVSLLDTYEPERIRFARRLVKTTDRVFTVVTRQSGFARQMRMRVAPRVVPWLFQSRFTRRTLFRTVSQIVVNYRGSPLSQGAAGGTRGGDRLPWVPAPDSNDNFAPLASLSWQVHLYGEPRPGVAEACEQLQLPLHVFPWRPEMKPCGLACLGPYLIRPDGYVALADPQADPKRLRDYIEKCGLRLSQRV